ncbi:potassium channel family protein [Streptomyces hirsutus]|uniref:potassium channel family protein n=1 Tax=Streptomyces hirsutus TaxID=35620 RepID=UPI00365EF107
MERGASNSFSASLSRTDAPYFAMTVFSTVGFGDITPRSEEARLLTAGQMTVNLLLIGVAARLPVNTVQEGRRQRDRSAAGSGTGANTHRPVPRRSVGSSRSARRLTSVTVYVGWSVDAA